MTVRVTRLLEPVVKIIGFLMSPVTITSVLLVYVVKITGLLVPLEVVVRIMEDLQRTVKDTASSIPQVKIKMHLEYVVTIMDGSHLLLVSDCKMALRLPNQFQS